MCQAANHGFGFYISHIQSMGNLKVFTIEVKPFNINNTVLV